MLSGGNNEKDKTRKKRRENKGKKGEKKEKQKKSQIKGKNKTAEKDFLG